MKTILITGGLGFIGSSLAKRLLALGHNVLCIDNLSTAVLEPTDSELNSHKGFEFHEMNLSSPDVARLERLLERADLIYHFAGSVGVAHIDRSPKESIQNNFFMNARLFPLFEKAKKKVVFASTSEVYGNRKLAKESEALTIGSPDVLRWGYACGKLMSEFLLRSMDFPFSIARFFNVTGKGQSGSQGMVVAKFVELALQGKPLTVYDQGEQVRSFCDIRDAVNMLLFLGEDARANGEIFNIGNDKNICSIKELAQMVQEKSPNAIQIRYIPFEDSFSSMTQDIRYRAPSMEKMQPYYQCKYSLSDIIDSMMEAK